MPEKSHTILPVCRLDRLDLDEIFNKFASNQYGGVIVSVRVSESIDVASECQKLPSAGDDVYKSWILAAQNQGPRPRPSQIPPALWDLMRSDLRILGALIEKLQASYPRTNENVHLIRGETIALGYHVDPVKDKSLRAYRLLQGEGMQIYNPASPKEIRGADVESLAIDSCPLDILIAEDTEGQVITAEPNEIVFFTSHTAHRSPLRPGPNSVRYTLG